MADTKITLLPVCVSSGDAIFICIEHKNNKHCYLVDGSKGSGGTKKYKQDQLKNPDVSKEPITPAGSQSRLSKGADELPSTANPTTVNQIDIGKVALAKKKSDWSKLLGTYETLKKAEYSLKGIIVTHPDWDHYGGIRYLFHNKQDIHCPVLITDRFVIEAEEADEKSYIENLLRVIERTHGGQVTKSSKIIGFPSWFEFHHPMANLVLYEWENQVGQRPKIPPDNEGSDTNETSIITTISNPSDPSKPLACLTGDAVLRDPQELSSYFTDKGTIPVFLVPHHGSKHNSSVTLYKNTRSEVYIISCGNHKGYKFPHKNTLAAICQASSENNIKAKIVLTNGRWLHSEKVKDIQEAWLEKISIYYWDEKVYHNYSGAKNNSQGLMTKPYLQVSLHPATKVEDEDVLEWSIHGYNKLISILNDQKQDLTFKNRNDKYLIIESGEVKLSSAKTSIKVIHLKLPSPTHPCDWDIENTVTILTDVTNNDRLVFLKRIKQKRGSDEFAIYQSKNKKQPWRVQYGTCNQDKIDWSELTFCTLPHTDILKITENQILYGTE